MGDRKMLLMHFEVLFESAKFSRDSLRASVRAGAPPGRRPSPPHALSGQQCPLKPLPPAPTLLTPIRPTGSANTEIAR